MQELIGVLLMLVGVGDPFMTVLYARIGSRVGSRLGMGLGRFVVRSVWAVCTLSTGRPRALLLSAAAPLTLVLMVVLWSSLLAFGAAFLIHPELGAGVRRTSGATPTDFMAALFAAGSSLSFVSNSDFQPQTSAMRMVFLVNALIGTATLMLTITYLMQIYRAVQTRNALGLKIQGMCGGCSSGPELLARWGPGGRFDMCYSSLSEVAGELAEVHEAHHLYPLLFYFRFDTDYPNPALYLPVLMDAMSLMHSALPARDYAWICESAAAREVSHGASSLLTMMERVFVPAGFRSPPPPLDRARTAADFARAVRRLRRAGIRVVGDEAAGALQYADCIESWYGIACRVAGYLGHDPESLKSHRTPEP